MATTTIQFNGGNPFSVGSSGVHSESHTLPSSVLAVELDLLDPNGDWVNAANAGGTFLYGVEFSSDGGSTWNTLISNGFGQPVGSLAKDGSLPTLVISRGTGLTEAYGLPCRAFASCNPQTITIAAQAIVTH